MATSSSSNPSPKPPFSSSSSSANTDVETLRRNRILSSKLYFHVPPSKVPLIYSTSYDIAFLGIEKMHPFDSSKWRHICQFLMTEGILDKNQIVEPLEASREDLLVVHSESYLNSLKSSLNVSIIIEVPPLALLPNCLVQQKVLHPFRKQVGGTILAGKLAKEQGWAINVGGGFHHCSGERGGGFCAYADISLCIHYAFVRLNISRVMIIDLDAHQGNGHEMDFAEDRRVYILDMFNTEVYPQDFEARRYIDQTVELVSETLNALDWVGIALAGIGTIGVGVGGEVQKASAVSLFSLPLLAFIVAILFVVLNGWLRIYRRHRREQEVIQSEVVEEIILGLEAGILFGLASVISKIGFVFSELGFSKMLVPMCISISICCSGTGFVYQTRGLKHGRAIVVSTCAAVASIVTGVVAGILALGERLPSAPLSRLLLLLGWVLIIVGVILLVSSTRLVRFLPRPLRGFLQKGVEKNLRRSGSVRVRDSSPSTVIQATTLHHLITSPAKEKA